MKHLPLLFFLMPFMVVNAQNDAPTPYLYYYEPLINNFVVERADGTDSRVLGERMLDPETNTASGKWSPSGRWFAWMSANIIELGAGGYRYNGGIISADGARTIAMFEGLDANYLGMEWLSNDYVYVSAVVEGTSAVEDRSVVRLLIDVPNNRIVDQEEAAYESPESHQPYNLETVELFKDCPPLFRQTARYIDTDPRLPDLSFEGVLSASPDTRYLGIGDSLLLYDTFTDEMISLRYHNHGATAARWDACYNWHSSSDWVIADQTLFWAGGGGGPRGSIVARVDGTFQRDLTTALRSPQWLPARVEAHLAPGQSQSVIRQPVTVITHENNVSNLAWNNNGSLLATIEGDGTVNIWSITDIAQIVRSGDFPTTLTCGSVLIACTLAWNIESSQITIFGSNAFNSIQFSVWNVQTGITIDASPGVPAPLLFYNGGRDAYLAMQNVPIAFDIHPYRPTHIRRTDTHEVIETINAYASAAALNPDETHLATISGQHVYIWDIRDITQSNME